MIVPKYTEKEILSELIKDYANVKKEAKKIASKHLLKAQKSGRFIRGNEFDSYTINTCMGNVWNLEIDYDQTKKNPWTFQTCCIVESEKKTKDYYLIRGLNTDKPYFVKVTTHTLLRYRDRNKMGDNTFFPFLACRTFIHGETGVCTMFVNFKFLQILNNMDDVDEMKDMSYIVFTHCGFYYAQRTPDGNFIFKTYISTAMGLQEMINHKKGKITKWSTEGELLSDLLLFHLYFNKKLYDKEVLDNYLYSIINKDEEYELKKNSPLILLKH